MKMQNEQEYTYYVSYHIISYRWLLEETSDSIQYHTRSRSYSNHYQLEVLMPLCSNDAYIYIYICCYFDLFIQRKDLYFLSVLYGVSILLIQVHSYRQHTVTLTLLHEIPNQIYRSSLCNNIQFNPIPSNRITSHRLSSYRYLLLLLYYIIYYYIM